MLQPKTFTHHKEDNDNKVPTRFQLKGDQNFYLKDNLQKSGERT